jgi:hypothetical protein
VRSSSTLSILDLDLDRTLRRIGRKMEGVDGVLKPESVSDEWLEIDQSASDEANCFRVLFTIGGEVSC